MGGETTEESGAATRRRRRASREPTGRETASWPFPWLRSILKLGEDLAHYAVAVLLMVLGVIVLYHTGAALLDANSTFPTRVISGIDGVLFVIIVIELMQTVLAHFERSGFQLKPFLIIGIISAVRHILTIGARLTVSGELGGTAFRESQIELGVETGVVLGLVVALLLIRVGDRMGRDDSDDE